MRPGSDRRNIESLDVESVPGDLLDPASLNASVGGCHEVYHAAAEYSFWSRHPGTAYRSNVEGTRNILEACAREGVGRVVYTSTVATFGVFEVEQLPPGSHYKRTKFQAERVALDYAGRGLPVVVVNPTAPIGPWDRRPTPTGKVVLDFTVGRMPAYLDTGLNFVHVRDVAEGHVLASEKGRVGARYILGNRNLSLAEFLGIVARVTGRRAPSLRIPYVAALAAGWVSTAFSEWVTRREPRIALEAVRMARRPMYFDPSESVRELGLPRTAIEVAVEDSVKWFSDNGYLNRGK